MNTGVTYGAGNTDNFMIYINGHASCDSAEPFAG